MKHKADQLEYSRFANGGNSNMTACVGFRDIVEQFRIERLLDLRAHGGL